MKWKVGFKSIYSEKIINKYLADFYEYFHSWEVFPTNYTYLQHSSWRVKNWSNVSFYGSLDTRRGKAPRFNESKTRGALLYVITVVIRNYINYIIWEILTFYDELKLLSEVSSIAVLDIKREKAWRINIS